MLGQQVLGVGIADVSGIANIADIADVADIVMDIADIVTDIADRVLQTLQWKQVGAYKVSQGCPVTIIQQLYKQTMDEKNRSTTVTGYSKEIANAAMIYIKK